jgi:hypothetical protein
MSGAFEVEFNFEETVSLDEGYKLKKPYLADAYELVEVAQDTGKSIALQHLLVVEGEDGPVVIKHWGQVWKYEDRRTLNYEGRQHMAACDSFECGCRGDLDAVCDTN